MGTQITAADSSNWSKAVNVVGMIGLGLVSNNSFGMANAPMTIFNGSEQVGQTYISSLDTADRNKVKNLGTTPLDIRIVNELNKKINANIQTGAGIAQSRALKNSANIELVTEADKTSKSRIKLLAMKYASSSPNNELLARLEMLNQRMLTQAPRVTEEKVLALEEADKNYQSLLGASKLRQERYAELIKQK